MAQVATAYVEVRPDLSNFAKFLRMGLAGVQVSKEVDIKPDLSGFDAEVSARIRSMRVPKIKPKVEPEVDKKQIAGFTKFLRGMAKKFDVGLIGRVFSKTLMSISNVAQGIAESAGKAFISLGERALEAGGALSGFGGMLTSTGGSLIKFAPQLANIASVIGSVVAATAILVPLLGGLSLALGAVLAVVIPLVAAVTALVGEIIALGGAVTASFALIPGAALGAAAAFGPLMLVMDKFQALFDKTSKAVGPLYEVMERLKRAIFAVISKDFVKTFKTFATTVLPKMFDGIEKVAAAWNKFFLGLFKLAEVPGFIDDINTVLALGAKLVGFFADTAAELGPALLDFAVAAAPALSSILKDIAGIVSFFGQWLTQMTKTSGATDMFAQVAGFAGQVLGLFKSLAPLMGSLMSATIGPATQFVAILGRIFDALNGMFSTVGGQAALRTFFEAMNTIVSELGTVLVNDVVPAVIEFGSMIKDAMVVARPLLSGFIGMLMQLLRNIMPGLMTFMGNMAKAFTDPGVMTAMEELGTSISDLLSILGDTNTVMAFAQVLSLVVDVAYGLIYVINQMAAPVTVLATAFKLATGNIKGAANDMAALMSRKSQEMGGNAVKLGTAWSNLAKSGNTSFDSMAAGITGFANAEAWQAIIDNANAASAAIGTMGRNAFEAKQLQEEKMLGRNWRAAQSQAKVRKVKKPKLDMSGVSDAWRSGWDSAVDNGLQKTKTSKTINKYLSSLKPTLGVLNVMDFIKAPRFYDTGQEIARYLAKGITSGSKNIAKATSIIYKANKKNLDSLAYYVRVFANQSKKYMGALPKTWAADVKKMTTVSQLNTYLEKQQNKWRAVLEDIVNFKKAVVDALTPNKNLTGIFGYFPTPGEVQARLDLMYRQMKEFTDGVARLQAKGLDPQLAREWLAAGIEGAGNMVAGLQNATTEQIAGINATFNKIGTEASAIADQQATAWKGVGEQTVRGYIDGIEAMQTEVTKVMVKMLADSLKAAKKSLGIKSPSTVFAGIGVDTMAGYIVGINAMASDTLGTVSDMYGAVADVPPAALATPQLKPALAHTGTLGQMQAKAPDVNVRVYIGDRELTDMVRVVLENADSTRARALLAGRRGG